MRNEDSELARMREVNLGLRRQLERARKDALLYAAQVCEDHIVVELRPAIWSVHEVKKPRTETHAGVAYAAKLREIAG